MESEILPAYFPSNFIYFVLLFHCLVSRQFLHLRRLNKCTSYTTEEEARFKISYYTCFHRYFTYFVSSPTFSFTCMVKKKLLKRERETFRVILPSRKPRQTIRVTVEHVMYFRSYLFV